MAFFQGKWENLFLGGGTEEEGEGERKKGPKRKETINPSKEEVIGSKEQHKIKMDKYPQRQETRVGRKLLLLLLLFLISPPAPPPPPLLLLLLLLLSVLFVDFLVFVCFFLSLSLSLVPASSKRACYLTPNWLKSGPFVTPVRSNTHLLAKNGGVEGGAYSVFSPDANGVFLFFRWPKLMRIQRL